MMKMQKILVVDDSEMNRSILADMLEDEYEIIEARNGIEAITAIKKQEDEICLVLLDIIMPEMDGFEVLTVMNRGGWIENIPVIMISAEVSSTYVDTRMIWGQWIISTVHLMARSYGAGSRIRLCCTPSRRCCKA